MEHVGGISQIRLKDISYFYFYNAYNAIIISVF